MLRLAFVLGIAFLSIQSCKTTSDSKAKEVFTPDFRPMVFDALPFSNQCSPTSPAENKPVCMSLQRRVYIGKELASDIFRVVVDDKAQTYSFDRTDNLQFRNAPAESTGPDFKFSWDRNNERIVKVDTGLFSNDRWTISAPLLTTEGATPVGMATLEFEAPKLKRVPESIFSGPYELDDQGRLVKNSDVALVNIRLDEFCSGAFTNNCAFSYDLNAISLYADPSLLKRAKFSAKSTTNGTTELDFAQKNLCSEPASINLINRSGQVVASGICTATAPNIGRFEYFARSTGFTPLEVYAIQFSKSNGPLTLIRLAGLTEFESPPQFPEITAIELKGLNSSTDIAVVKFKQSDKPLEKINFLSFSGIDKNGDFRSCSAGSPSNETSTEVRLIFMPCFLPLIDSINNVSINNKSISSDLVKNMRVSDPQIQSLSFLALPDNKSQIKVNWLGASDSVSMVSLEFLCNEGSTILRFSSSTSSQDKSLTFPVDTPAIKNCQLGSAVVYYKNAAYIDYSYKLTRLIELKDFP